MHKNTFSRSGLLNTEKTKKSSIKFSDNINDNNPFVIESNKDIRKLKKNKKLEKEYTKQINQYNSLSKDKNDTSIYNNKKFCTSNNSYKKISKTINNDFFSKSTVGKSNKVISSIKINHNTFYSIINKRDFLNNNINNLVIKTNHKKNDNSNIINIKQTNFLEKSLNLIDNKNNSYIIKQKVPNTITRKKSMNINLSLSQKLINKKIQDIKTIQRIHSYINNIIERIPNKFEKQKNNNKNYILKNKHLIKKSNKCLSHNNILERNSNYNNTSNSVNLKKRCRKKNFQKILFNITNIKFKHLLLLFLDQKSIMTLSSLNKIFHKNLRNKFFVYIYDKLLSSKNKHLTKKILRSVFYNSTYVISRKYYDKNEFLLYYKSIKFLNPKYNDAILKDLLRTFPDDQNFIYGSAFYNKLYNLLSSYSNLKKNIGYTQGLNFLFGNAIYLFDSEDEIFLFIDGLINLLQLDKYICINNQTNLQKKMKEFKDILKKYVPVVVEYFSNKNLGVEFFTTSWLLTLFSASMNIKNLIVCWCFMILFRWKFFYSFVIQILVKYQKIIFSAEDRELCEKTKNILHSKEFIRDFNEICSKTMQFMKDHIVL